MSIKNFFLKNQTNHQSIAKNTAWLWLGQIGSQIIRTLIIIYATRVLGAAGYGAFANAVGITGFFIIFSDLGLNTILVRESAKNEKRNQYIATAFLIKLTLVLLGFLIIVAIGPSLTKVALAKELIPLVALVFALDALKDFGISLARSLEKMEIEAFASISGSLVMAVSAIFLFRVSATPIHLVYAYLAGSAWALLLTIILEKEYFKNLKGNFKKALIKPMACAALPLAASTIFGSVLIFGDTIMLGWFRTAREVGLYNAAKRIIQLLYLVSAILALSVLPVFSRLARKREKELKLILEKTVGIVLLIGLPIIIGGFILSKEIILLVFGGEYTESGPAFSILIFTLLLIYPVHIVTNLIIAYNRQTKIIKFWFLGALGNIILNLILIPTWGIIGAALALLAGNALAQIPIYIEAQKIMSFKLFSKLKKVALATILMSLLVLGLNRIGSPVVLTIPLGMVAYGLSLLVFKEPLFAMLLSIKKLFSDVSVKDGQLF